MPPEGGGGSEGLLGVTQGGLPGQVKLQMGALDPNGVKNGPT